MSSGLVAAPVPTLVTCCHACCCLQGFEAMLTFMLKKVVYQMQALGITSPPLTSAADALAKPQPELYVTSGMLRHVLEDAPCQSCCLLVGTPLIFWQGAIQKAAALVESPALIN